MFFLSTILTEEVMLMWALNDLSEVTVFRFFARLHGIQKLYEW